MKGILKNQIIQLSILLLAIPSWANNLIVFGSTNHQPIITTPNNVKDKSICEGTTVTFNFSTNDSDLNDTLTISWNKEISGASWSSTNGIYKHPTATLTFTPKDTFTQDYEYTFAVTVMDNAYPVRGSFTEIYHIKVFAHPQARIIISDSGCGEYWFFAKRIVGNSPTYSWIGSNFTFNPMIGPLTKHKFRPGKYPFSMTMLASLCSITYHDTLIVDTFITNYLPADTSVCFGAIVTLKSRVKYNKGPITMLWGTGNRIFGSSTGLTKTLKVTQDTVIWSRASDTSENCPVSDTIHIKLLDCVSINNQESLGNIKISPNPASDMVTISIDKPISIFKTISIYNNFGILVNQFTNIGANKLTINRDFVNNGLYFVKIMMMNGEVINTKLIWK